MILLLFGIGPRDATGLSFCRICLCSCLLWIESVQSVATRLGQCHVKIINIIPGELNEDLVLFVHPKRRIMEEANWRTILLCRRKVEEGTVETK